MKVKKLSLLTFLLLTSMVVSLTHMAEAKRPASKGKSQAAKTIVLSANHRWFTLYPSGKAVVDYEGPTFFTPIRETYTGTWTAYTRRIGVNNNETYYEIRYNGETEYWVKGSNYVYHNYNAFSSNDTYHAYKVSISYQ